MEQTGDWLVYSFLLDGKGGGSLLSMDDFKAWKPAKGILWMHIDLDTAGAKEWLSQKSGIDELIVENILEEDEPRARCLAHGDGLYVVLRSINLNPGEEPDDMIPVRIWCDKNRIITMRSRPFVAARELERKLITGVGPYSIGGMLDEICSCVLDVVVAEVADLEDIIDDVEEKIIANTDDSEEEELMLPLLEGRRKLSTIRRYLAPQRDAMDLMPRQLVTWLDKEERYQLRENAHRLTRIIEDIDSLRERAHINMDALNGRFSGDLQKNLFVLSVIATLFMPLTFLTGLFGMNVGGIPLADDPNGLWILTGVFTLAILLLALVFKRLKWF